MENNHPALAGTATGLATAQPRPGWGPAPAERGDPDLSPAPAALLDVLRGQHAPVTLAALCQLTDKHPNTVRGHLDTLVDLGLVRRHTQPPHGRGRPSLLFEATARSGRATAEYAGLAATLAATIHRTSPTPVDDAVDAGRHWGHDLAEARGARPTSSATAARGEVVSLLDDLGFAPEPTARNTKARLTRCPLLEAAHQFPDIVCGVHLGLVQGGLDAYGAEPDEARLEPFAEPGACLLQLAAERP